MNNHISESKHSWLVNVLQEPTNINIMNETSRLLYFLRLNKFIFTVIFFTSPNYLVLYHNKGNNIIVSALTCANDSLCPNSILNAEFDSL